MRKQFILTSDYDAGREFLSKLAAEVNQYGIVSVDRAKEILKRFEGIGFTERVDFESFDCPPFIILEVPEV